MVSPPSVPSRQRSRRPAIRIEGNRGTPARQTAEALCPRGANRPAHKRFRSGHGRSGTGSNPSATAADTRWRARPSWRSRRASQGDARIGRKVGQSPFTVEQTGMPQRLDDCGFCHAQAQDGGPRAEDRQERARGPEHAAEEGAGVGRNQSDALRDSLGSAAAAGLARDRLALPRAVRSRRAPRDPTHPVWRRCFSLKYARYSRSARLARRASRRPKCVSYFLPGP